VLNTVAEGVTDGSLTVVETDGTIELLSNRLRLSGKAAYGWDLGAYEPTGIARALGYTLLGKWEGNHANAQSYVGWQDTAVVADRGAADYAAGFGVAAEIYAYSDAETTVVVAMFVADTEYEVALVLGGYDSSEVPWYSGKGGTNDYGCAFYIKGGVFTRYATHITYYDSIRVPDSDLSAVLQPTCLSTFDAANGTSLDTANLPEVGADWVEQAGNWDIQGNRAENGSAGTDIATVDAAVADVMVDVTAQLPVGGADHQITSVVRFSDTSNHWIIGLTDVSAKFRIIELNAGGATERATTNVVVNAATDYDIRAVLDGQTIDAYLDGGDKISYGSAALNETVTKHGIRTKNEANCQFENFAVYPRTAAIFDSTFGAV
jgi:hypothetical protein